MSNCRLHFAKPICKFIHSTAILLLSCAYTLEKSYGTIDVFYLSSKELNIPLCWGKKYLYQQGCQWVVLLSVLSNLALGEMEVANSGEAKLSF